MLPEHIHPELFDKDMAIVNPAGAEYYATPVSSSILLYEKDQGYPNFNEDQAKEYFKRVNDRVVELIDEIIFKWDNAKLFR